MQIITSIIPIFAVIFLGTTLRRFGLIDDSFVKTANRLIFYICLPVLLFHKISTASLNQTIRWLPIDIMLTAILSVSILAFLLAKAFHWPLKTGGTLAVNSFRGNFAYMALPVCYYTFGDQGLVIGSVFMGVLIPFVNTLAVISFTIGGTKRFRFQPILLSTLLNPLFLGCVLGLSAALMRLRLPAPADKTLAIISQVTLPLALFSIGGGIRFRNMGWFHSRLWMGTAFKLLLLPFLGYLALKLTSTPIRLPEQVMVIMLASPSALVNYVMADQMNGDPELSTGIIILSTIGSIFTFTFWLHIVGI
ncbi:MAG: AEC family transporter [Acidobacteria bacterium]|nr:MAG: AEC family transporter [Acidobacteriota bacterium]